MIGSHGFCRIGGVCRIGGGVTAKIVADIVVGGAGVVIVGMVVRGVGTIVRLVYWRVF
ncbi:MULTISPECIES: hypothetical protein [Bartonella]|uniref:hypothetical protein n=1 Tax=Bartonella TaxID=773 RepID=UPI00235F52D0|nr:MULTISPECIES: hypothetical protein [Bartonella]